MLRFLWYSFRLKSSSIRTRRDAVDGLGHMMKCGRESSPRAVRKLISLFLGPSKDVDRCVRRTAVGFCDKVSDSPQVIEACRNALFEDPDYWVKSEARTVLRKHGYSLTLEEEKIVQRSKVEDDSKRFKRGDLVEYVGHSRPYLQGCIGEVYEFDFELAQYIVSFVRSGHGPMGYDADELEWHSSRLM